MTSFMPFSKDANAVMPLVATAVAVAVAAKASPAVAPNLATDLPKPSNFLEAPFRDFLRLESSPMMLILMGRVATGSSPTVGA